MTKKLAHNDLTVSERLSLTNELIKLQQEEADAAQKAAEDELATKLAAVKEEKEERDRSLKEQLADGGLSETAYKQAQFQSEIDYLTKLRDLYAEGSKERADYERQIQDKLLDDKLDKQKQYLERYSAIEKELGEGARNKELLETTKQVLDTMVKSGKITQEEADTLYKNTRDGMSEALKIIKQTSESATPATSSYTKTLKKLNEELKQGIITEEEYAQAKQEAQKDAMSSLLGNSWSGQLLDMQSSFGELFDIAKQDASEFGDGIDGITGRLGAMMEALAKGVGTATSFMTSTFDTASQFVEASAQIEQNAIESRYDREIELAEGNSYKTKQLEKKKEEELAASKNKASKKQYKMKVIEAVAQTAQNVIAAIGAGMQAGYPLALVMVPLLTAMAAAQGAVQLALLKKQQKAAEATGYAEGGFTRPGSKYEEAGIVHAGEWVASQKLVKSPQARPLIDALEYAQRTNTIGSLRMADVQQISTSVLSSTPDTTQYAATTAAIYSTLSRLNKRLAEPFVTVNTVSGDNGIKQAQDEYNRLIRNKTPKSQWK